jgi:hypothetical protein
MSFRQQARTNCSVQWCSKAGGGACPRCSRRYCESHGSTKGSRCEPCEREFALIVLAQKRRRAGPWLRAAIGSTALLGIPLGLAAPPLLPLAALPFTAYLGRVWLSTRDTLRKRFLAETLQERAPLLKRLYEKSLGIPLALHWQVYCPKCAEQDQQRPLLIAFKDESVRSALTWKKIMADDADESYGRAIVTKQNVPFIYQHYFAIQLTTLGRNSLERRCFDCQHSETIAASFRVCNHCTPSEHEWKMALARYRCQRCGAKRRADSNKTGSCHGCRERNIEPEMILDLLVCDNCNAIRRLVAD